VQLTVHVVLGVLVTQSYGTHREVVTVVVAPSASAWDSAYLRPW
jgi:hypothetical protein